MKRPPGPARTGRPFHAYVEYWHTFCIRIIILEPAHVRAPDDAAALPVVAVVPGAEGDLTMQKIWRESSLSIVTLGLFLLFWAGMSFVAYLDHNSEQETHNAPTIGYGEYLVSGEFWEATAENWESEFLQMGLFVLLTVFLRQKGSPESKQMENEPVDANPREKKERLRAGAPWPVRQGGLALRLYENSLTLVLLAFFFVSFVLHGVGGLAAFNQEQVQHGEQAVSLAQYMTGHRFWFESLQNWQSEFMAIGALVVLSIFLRQRGSPESKPVAAPHYETGHE
jgi:hypothetical protein